MKKMKIKNENVVWSGYFGGKSENLLRMQPALSWDRQPGDYLTGWAGILFVKNKFVSL